MKTFKNVLDMDELDVAKVFRKVRKEYKRYDEYRDPDDFDKAVYETVKDEYGDDPNKFYVSMIAMDLCGIEIRDNLEQEIDDNWNSMMARVTG